MHHKQLPIVSYNRVSFIKNDIYYGQQLPLEYKIHGKEYVYKCNLEMYSKVRSGSSRSCLYVNMFNAAVQLLHYEYSEIQDLRKNRIPYPVSVLTETERASL